MKLISKDFKNNEILGSQITLIYYRVRLFDLNK